MSEPSNWVVVLLKQARSLIATKGWCQDSYAKNASGQKVCVTSPNATSFCMLGALGKALLETPLASPTDCFDAAVALTHVLTEWDCSITKANDGLPFTEDGKARVLSYFDTAIATLQEVPH